MDFSTFKNYGHSKKVTLISILGSIIKAISIVGLFLIVVVLISGGSDFLNVPLLIIGTIALGILGMVIKKRATEIAYNEWSNRVKEDIEFAKTEAIKKPELKKQIMNINKEYSDYVTSSNEITE